MSVLRWLAPRTLALPLLGCVAEPGGIVVQDLVQTEFVCPDTGSNSYYPCRHGEGEFWAESDAPGSIDVRATHLWANSNDVIDVALSTTPGVRISVTYTVRGGRELSGLQGTALWDVSYTLCNVPPGNWSVESPKAPTIYYASGYTFDTGHTGDYGEFAVDVTVE